MGLPQAAGYRLNWNADDRPNDVSQDYIARVREAGFVVLRFVGTAAWKSVVGSLSSEQVRRCECVSSRHRRARRGDAAVSMAASGTRAAARHRVRRDGSPAGQPPGARSRPTQPGVARGPPTMERPAAARQDDRKGRSRRGKEGEETDNPLPRLRRSERSERRAKRGGESPWAVEPATTCQLALIARQVLASPSGIRCRRRRSRFLRRSTPSRARRRSAARCVGG